MPPASRVELANTVPALASALFAAAVTPWIDLFPAYRVRRFGTEVWAVMAASAFVFALLWFTHERARSHISCFAFALRAVPYAMACCAFAVAAWVCPMPHELSLSALASAACSSLVVALWAAVTPVWLAPLFAVLVVLGAPLFATQRALLDRSMSTRTADAIVAACALCGSSLCAWLAWTHRLPHALFSTSYAPALARWLSLAALVANALVLLRSTLLRRRALT